MPMLLSMLFFLSGLAGLIYQVTWSRQLLLIYGNTIYSITTVVSVFMFGLALGSLFFGWISDKTKNHLKLFSFLEFLIAIFSLLSIFSFDWIRDIYLTNFYGNYHIQHGLLYKFLLSTLVILPPTFLMGGTLPLLIKYKSKIQKLSKATADLYFINTLGSFMGTLLTAYIFIEVLGLTNTVAIAASINFFIGLAGTLFLKKRKQNITKKASSQNIKKAIPKKLCILIFIYFLSGIIAMSYEILWTRMLTPVTGTYIYAFALILAVILLGIALGSYFYKIVSKYFQDKIYLFALLELGIGIFAFLSLLIISLNINLHYLLRLFIVLFPASLLMGTIFPLMTSFLEEYRNIGFWVGTTFAANTLGSIIGPILTGFFLIGYLGTSRSIVYLSLINIILAFFLTIFSSKRSISKILFKILIFFCLLNFAYENNFTFLDAKTQQLVGRIKENEWNHQLLEDEVASIFAYSSGGSSKDEKGLYIDGVLTTTLTPQTKLLAHLPLFLHKDPDSALVIAFGMGTSFRSALTHDIEVDAVELVPSVFEVFNMFHNDTETILKSKKANVYINDGRNYILLTDKRYDVIVVDPPPPINAAGTTVLYSQEFYEDCKNILNKDGILVQWFWYGAREDDLKMLFASFRKVFPNILVAISPDGRGVFFIGTENELTINKRQISERYKGKVHVDLNEWNQKNFNLENILSLFVGSEKIVDRFIQNTQPVKDNYPKTEYFFLRHKLKNFDDISADWVHPIEKLY